MHGTLLQIPAAGSISQKVLDRPPDVGELQAAVGGFLEIVPWFDSIGYGGVVMHCVVFCDEDGKHKELPPNERASKLWHRALERNRMRTLIRDQLVGPVAVVFGDRELMSEL